MDGEYPVYVTDETFDKWYYEAGALSLGMKSFIQACTFGIAPDSALQATSPQLYAMLQRAAILNDMDISDDEKRVTAEYFATLNEIKVKAYKERDEKAKKDGEVENG